MLVISSVDGSGLLELQLEGRIAVNPEQARQMLNELVKSYVGANLVTRLIGTSEWVKTDSPWGSDQLVAASALTAKPSRHSMCQCEECNP